MQNLNRIMQNAPGQQQMQRGENNITVNVRRTDPTMAGISAMAGCSALSACGTAATMAPTAGNCLTGTVTSGALGQAAGAAAVGGALTVPAAAAAAVVGGLACGPALSGSAPFLGAEDLDEAVSACPYGSAGGAAIAGVGTALLAPGMIAKGIAPHAFTHGAAQTGANVLGGTCAAAGTTAAGAAGLAVAGALAGCLLGCCVRTTCEAGAAVVEHGPDACSAAYDGCKDMFESCKKPTVSEAPAAEAIEGRGDVAATSEEAAMVDRGDSSVEEEKSAVTQQPATEEEKSAVTEQPAAEEEPGVVSALVSWFRPPKPESHIEAVPAWQRSPQGEAPQGEAQPALPPV